VVAIDSDPEFGDPAGEARFIGAPQPAGPLGIPSLKFEIGALGGIQDLLVGGAVWFDYEVRHGRFRRLSSFYVIILFE